MAKVHVSPGAYFQTTDLSSYVPRLTQSAYGVIGRFRQGPTEPTIIGDTQTFLDVFGIPDEGMYSALSALLYLKNGNQLYVKRMVGVNAKKAIGEIPAGSVIQNEEILSTDGKDYQFHLSLDHSPIPGTLVLNVGNNVFYDNGSGKILGGATSLYCNYIDYDSGLFRFTMVEPPAEGEDITIRYNGKLCIISDEMVGVTGTRDGNPSETFSGYLKRPNIYFPTDESVIEVNVGSRVLRGKTLDSNGLVELKTPVDSGSSLEDTGTVDPETGEIVITFDATEIPEANQKIYVNYNTFSEKETLVGVGDGHTRAFSGYINERVSPGTSSIWVGGDLISEDMRTGDYTGANLLYSDNSVDYTTGTIKLGLTFEPDEGTVITATYSTKADTVLYVFDEEDKPKIFEGQIDVSPVIKGSVEITAGDLSYDSNNNWVSGLYLKDDGEGYLVGVGGNGTIDYATGKLKVNMYETPEIGTVVRCFYLAKYGEIQALYEGEYGDGFKGKFSYIPNTGYNFEVWTQNQDPYVDSPDEYWHNLDFANTASNNYVTTKVSSYNVRVVPNVTDIYLEPLLGRIIETSGGESDVDNISEDEAIAALDEFSNPESYDINLLAIPDFAGNKRIMQKMASICEDRGEAFCVIDTPQGLTPRQAVDWTNAESSWNQTTKFDSSFAAIYYPWIYVNNPVTGSTELVPPSVAVPSTYTYSDNIAASWYAPAGVARGQLANVVGLERTLTLEDRNLLYGYPNVINPIISIPNQGIVLWGQKTTQRKSTALDRIHVRRLINYIAKVMATAFMDLIFEPSDHITWTQYKQIVQPILEQIQTERGLYDCQVICDASTNPDEVIEKNEMHAKVRVVPLKNVEVIETNFILDKQTGTTTVETD